MKSDGGRARAAASPLGRKTPERIDGNGKENAELLSRIIEKPKQQKPSPPVEVLVVMDERRCNENWWR